MEVAIIYSHLGARFLKFILFAHELLMSRAEVDQQGVESSEIKTAALSHTSRQVHQCHSRCCNHGIHLQ